MQLMETNQIGIHGYILTLVLGIVHIYTYVLNSVEAVLLYIVNEY